MKPNLSQEVNSKVLEVWDRYALTRPSLLLPLLYPEEIRWDQSLLIIGLNPSFSTRTITVMIRKSASESMKKLKDKSESDIEDIHRWNNRNDESNMKAAMDIQNEALESYAYFKRFNELSPMIFEEPGSNSNAGKRLWEHIDLFFYRETKQKEIEKKVRTWIKSPGKSDTFWTAQLRLSFWMIGEVKPKIILIQNAFACRLFVEQSELREENDLHLDQTCFERLGYDLLRVKDRRIPIFFSGPLPGMRALDNESLRRLSWEMKRALQGCQ